MTTATAVSPRQMFSVLDHGYRDIAVAADAVAGRFTSCGRTLTVGAVPDWRADPYPEDKEWRIEWVKFYYGLDLAHAYAATRDDEYLRAWLRLVDSYIAQVPPRQDDTEVAARRIQNWIYAWNRFAAVAATRPALDAASARIAGYLWQEVGHVRANLTRERNHRTLELYALLVAALAFPHLDRQRLAVFAFDELHANLLADVRPDGVHREGSTHYHCIALRSFLGAMHNAERAGLPVPDSYIERVTRASEFALHCHRPDRRIPACSDADNDSYADVLRLAGRLLDRADFVWGATAGTNGAAPARRAASFSTGGYYTQRSGWGIDRPYANERFLIFDCGPLGDGGHGHYDQLSVEVFANGRPLVVDPGRFTYAEADPNWRHWFKGTAAHNTVLIDGLDQTGYARRKPTGPVASGRLLTRATAPHLDLLMGTCASPCYEAMHTRAVLFVANEYWLVADYLEGQQPHVYQQRWHLSPEVGAAVAIRSDAPGVVEGRGLRMAFEPAGSLHIEDGWVAPGYGVKHPARVVVATSAATSALFVTAIVPLDPGSGRALTLRVATPATRPADQMVVEVRGAGASGTSIDTLTWSSACRPLTAGDFRGIARAAWTRADARGCLVALAATDVLEGTWRNTQRVGNGTPSLWVSWSLGETSLTALRDEI